MSSTPPASPTLEPNVPTRLDPIAGLLSYLIPGLGQISQGRVGKGLLFFFSLYALFFYGMALGQWTNVYLPSTDRASSNVLSRVINDLYSRPHFAGQFFVGVAAWPAVYQYRQYDDNKEVGPVFGRYQRAPREPEINRRQRDENKRWDLGWVYTVIAGVLNILVIYDALAGPAFREVAAKEPKKDEKEPEKVQEKLPEPLPETPIETPKEPVTP